ncbi:MAG: type II toxin-antitoxin system RelE/ParE family toxin [Candidatus Uhrbacteria bacterium]|nr:type II toxin-antitoxin system RelE/ParE family toxin [Candidatus Uhrbacteria bacterium]
MYEVHIEKRAVKELEKIAPEERGHILKKISTILSSNPFPVGNNPKRLKGERVFRLRIGDYRAIYTIEGSMILVYAIRNRKDAYR